MLASANDDCDLPTESGNYNGTDHEWKIDNSDAHQGTDTGGIYDYAHEIKGAMVYTGSEYNPNNRWEHYFLAGSHITAARKLSSQSESEYSQYPNCAGHSLEIINDDPNIASLKTTNNPSDVGGYPLEAEEETAEYGDAAFTVIFFALGTVNPFLRAGLTAVQATAALANSGETGTGSNTQHFGWNYGLDELACEAINFSTFSIECHDGHSTASVETKHRAAQNAGRGNVDVHFWNTVDADPPDDPGCPPGEVCPVPEEEGPEPGTSEYIDYLENSDEFEEVSQDESSSDRIDVNSNEPVYIAKNPVVRGGLGSRLD